MKKSVISILALTLLLSACGSKGEIKLKTKVVTLEVNEKLNKDVDYYFKGDTTGLKINWKGFNSKVLNTYKLVATKNKDKYPFKVKVVDTKAPKIKNKKDLYVYQLGNVNIEQVKQDILSNLTVKDNYDKDISLVSALENLTIPNEEQQLVCNLQVKDSSKNKSNKVAITIQFTKDGKEAKDLKEKEVKVKEVIATSPTIKPNNKEVAVVDNNEKPVTPPAVTPPVVTPPAVTPPAVTPPAVTPPAVTPPVSGLTPIEQMTPAQLLDTLRFQNTWNGEIYTVHNVRWGVCITGFDVPLFGALKISSNPYNLGIGVGGFDGGVGDYFEKSTLRINSGVRPTADGTGMSRDITIGAPTATATEREAMAKLPF